MKTRLAKKEYTGSTSISIKRSDELRDCSLHGHDFYELDIITGGEAVATTNGKSEKARRGAVYFLTPEDFHEYSDTRRFSVINVQFFGDDVSSTLLRSLVDAECRAFALTESNFDTVCDLFGIMERLGGQSGLTTDIMPRLLESILLILHGYLDIAPATNSQAENNIQRALIYIQEHFRENPTLTEVASLLSFNERYFCKRFKEYTGMTYKEYLRQKKLQYARRLVLSTSMPIIEICDRCGYNTQSHFNREFHKEYGISPLALRKSFERVKPI
ncbi:MAG: AraC family transcriptional regulator [Clostridia bacterium]|nr:AraC family transcriptional regulator [Clostridia bacterium]